MSNHQSDPYDSLPPDASDEWKTILQMRNKLANSLRHYLNDEEVNPVEELNKVKRLLDNMVLDPSPLTGGVEQSIRDLIAGYWEHVALRRLSVSTGMERLNKALGGGLESKRLLVLLGGPGIGKTALANQIADYTADTGRPVLYVTSEDVPFTLFAKTLARIGDVNYTAVLKGWKDEQARIKAALALQLDRKSTDTLRYVDATQGLTLDAMKTLAQAHFSNHTNAGQGVLVVDYLQRFARAQRDLLAAGRDLREVVTVLTERLRSIACELDCCVIALAAQHRASGYGKNGNPAESTIASAKESGDIEYTADVIMALVEDKDRKVKPPMKARLLRIDKNRMGDTTGDDPIQLEWYGERQRFLEVAF